ncbi:MAG: 2Fe-2S iron-sulfur cluster-binding protein [Chloroflexota bacterium]
MTQITLTIDGQEAKFEEEITILEALQRVGKNAPVICFHEATKPEGICRQCVVEVEGWRVLAPSCVTNISDGMVIHTESERVVRSRRTILEMLNASVDLSEAPDLQEQIMEYQADPARFPEAKSRQQPIKDDNPFFIRDYAKCIICWRCTQACGDDAQFTYAIAVGGRGHQSKISTFFDAPLPESTCVFCGNCIAVCPTNALKSQTEFFLEQGLDYDQVRVEKQAARKKLRKAK